MTLFWGSPIDLGNSGRALHPAGGPVRSYRRLPFGYSTVTSNSVPPPLVTTFFLTNQSSIQLLHLLIPAHIPYHRFDKVTTIEFNANVPDLRTDNLIMLVFRSSSETPQTQKIWQFETERGDEHVHAVRVRKKALHLVKLLNKHFLGDTRRAASQRTVCPPNVQRNEPMFTKRSPKVH
jgi:hypothetical protein